MFSKFVNWLLSKTKLGQLVDGNKTTIGFALVCLAYAIEILSQAASLFPQYQAIAQITASLKVLQAQLSDFLKEVGLGVMVVGVGHKAIKESVSGPGVG